MAVSTDITAVVRSALDNADFVYFTRSFLDEDGDRFDDFLIRYSYDHRAKTEIDYLVKVQTYADGARILTIQGNNTHVYDLDRRPQMLEAIHEYSSRYHNPKVVLTTNETVLHVRTEVHYPVRSGLLEAMFDVLLRDFASANFAFLRWLADTDHGRQIPADEDEHPPEPDEQED